MSRNVKISISLICILLGAAVCVGLLTWFFSRKEKSQSDEERSKREQVDVSLSQVQKSRCEEDRAVEELEDIGFSQIETSRRKDPAAEQKQARRLESQAMTYEIAIKAKTPTSRTAKIKDKQSLLTTMRTLNEVV